MSSKINNDDSNEEYEIEEKVTKTTKTIVSKKKKVQVEPKHNENDIKREIIKDENINKPKKEIIKEEKKEIIKNEEPMHIEKEEEEKKENIEEEISTNKYTIQKEEVIRKIVPDPQDITSKIRGRRRGRGRKRENMNLGRNFNRNNYNNDNYNKNNNNYISYINYNNNNYNNYNNRLDSRRGNNRQFSQRKRNTFYNNKNYDNNTYYDNKRNNNRPGTVINFINVNKRPIIVKPLNSEPILIYRGNNRVRVRYYN